MYYPSDLQFECEVPAEVALFRHDQASLGVVNDLENWYVTESWASKFRDHLGGLLPLAEKGNVLAQYSVAVIYMLGYCYTSEDVMIAKWASHDGIEMTRWLVSAARQGHMCAVDNLTSTGVGPEADRVRSVYLEIAEEVRQGAVFPPGETWRRVYGNAQG